MRLSLEMEQHDDACLRCGDPKVAGVPCPMCALEDSAIGCAGSQSAGRLIDDTDRARNQRRRDNGLEAPDPAGE